ncbi:MAG TPA: NAD-dependent epimerase/dehydratase family protein [Solirubrobacteraceae bacterium]|nr:NAD-dependent epimerase/dehydratase family protein [Solirubrobacteraceae bacterium]
MPPEPNDLVVAVTGPTGTFGHGLVPLLETESGVRRVVGIARRPFDPRREGWSKLEYRRGDVRRRDALVDAFTGADVVVHLAFLITGTSRREAIRQVNIEGTRNAFEAAREAGVTRFVYASSVAAYGFHADNPIGMTEDWPVRPAARLFYAQEKAELESLLTEEAMAAPHPELYLLRPPIVLGPHAAGAKATVPEPLARAALAILGLAGHMRLPLPVLAAEVPMQFIHEADVGQALLRCVLGEGPPGAYNIAGDGVLTGSDVVRELGLMPVPVPAGVVHTATRTLASLPWPGLVPPAAEWVEALSHPSIMDTSKAREELGWRPAYSGLEALRDTLGSLHRS